MLTSGPSSDLALGISPFWQSFTFGKTALQISSQEGLRLNVATDDPMIDLWAQDHFTT